MTFNVSTEGEQTLSVVEKDGSDTWQKRADATTYSWTIDTPPPFDIVCNPPEDTIGNHAGPGHSARGLKKNRRSLPLSDAHTVTATAIPVPDCLSFLRLMSTGTTERLIIPGAHFTAPVAGAWIIADDGTRTALTDITEVSEEEIPARLTIPPGSSEGRYHVMAENSNDLAKAVSALQVEIAVPSILATFSDKSLP